MALIVNVTASATALPAIARFVGSLLRNALTGYASHRSGKAAMNVSRTPMEDIRMPMAHIGTALPHLPIAIVRPRNCS
jgi:hypothetical protein